MQNLVCEWVDISKFGQIWAKIGSNLRKFWEKSVILFKIWPKIEPIGIWMGYFSLKNWYLYGSIFKFRGSTSLPKPNLSTPPPGYSVSEEWVMRHMDRLFYRSKPGSKSFKCFKRKTTIIDRRRSPRALISPLHIESKIQVFQDLKTLKRVSLFRFLFCFVLFCFVFLFCSVFFICFCLFVCIVC